MKLSFATLGCPAWTLEQIAHQAAALGFDGVELRGVAGEHLGPDESPAERARIRRLFDAAGVEIACIMGYSSFTHDDETARRESIEVALRLIDTAHDIGCRRLRVFGGSAAAGRAKSARRLADGLRALAPRAEAAGVTVVLETHDDWCHGEDVRDVLESVASPSIGACWDVANSFQVEPHDRTFRAIRDFVRHVHFKDAGREADGHVKSRLPGLGEVPMLEALQRLRDSGYAGYLSFEWEKKWEPELPDPEIAFPHFIRHVRSLMRQAGVDRSRA